MLSKEEKQAVIDLVPFLDETPIVFDIGSNKGHWSDVILDEYGEDCKLYLFEPNKKYLDFTEVKYEYKNNIVYEKMLAYKANIQAPFYFFENYNNELSSVYVDDNWVKEGLPMKQGTVRGVRLDTYCKAHGIGNIDLLKIDCEGSDIDVLVGCETLLKEDKIKIIQIEYSEHYKRGNHTIDEVFEIANKYGYKIYKYSIGNFFEVKSIPQAEFYDNYYLTKYNIHNYSVGWNREFIINTCEIPKLSLVLEVGCFEGLTTKYICEKMLEEGGRVVCVDPLEEYYTPEDTEHKEMFIGQRQRFLRNTRGLPINLMLGKSEDELPKLHELRFDFIYIDGDHREEAVYKDAINSMPILKGGGYLLFDDYQWKPETKAGIDKFLQEHSSLIEIVFQSYQVLIRKL